MTTQQEIYEVLDESDGSHISTVMDSGICETKVPGSEEHPALFQGKLSESEMLRLSEDDVTTPERSTTLERTVQAPKKYPRKPQNPRKRQQKIKPIMLSGILADLLCIFESSQEIMYEANDMADMFMEPNTHPVQAQNGFHCIGAELENVCDRMEKLRDQLIRSGGVSCFGINDFER